MAIKHCLTSDSAWLNGAIRRRWSPAELLALERWAGVLPVQMRQLLMGDSFASF